MRVIDGKKECEHINMKVQNIDWVEGDILAGKEMCNARIGFGHSRSLICIVQLLGVGKIPLGFLTRGLWFVPSL